MRAADPGTRPVGAMLIAQFTADNVDLLAARVAVAAELLPRRPAHQRDLLP